MKVLLFGRLADVAGWRERTLAAPTLSALRRMLADGDAGLAAAIAAPGVRAAVDQVLVDGDVALHTASEVAFMPPMSGG